MANTDQILKIVDLSVRLLGPLVAKLIDLGRELHAVRDRGGEITEAMLADADVEFEAAAAALEAAANEAREPTDADDVSP